MLGVSSGAWKGDYRMSPFAVTVFDQLTARYTVIERTLLGAISEASSRLESVIEEHLR